MLTCLIYARGTEIPDPKSASDTPSTSSVEAPDPATPFLVGTGLVGVSLVVRHMRRKRDD